MAEAAAKRVLIVEDEPGYQELMATLLGRAYSLEIRSSVEAALERLAKARFDLAIVDINLIGMSGLALMERLRQDERHQGMPVVFCSSQFDPKTKLRASELGAAGFLEKPFQIDHLSALVRTLLGP